MTWIHTNIFWVMAATTRKTPAFVAQHVIDWLPQPTVIGSFVTFIFFACRFLLRQISLSGILSRPVDGRGCISPIQGSQRVEGLSFSGKRGGSFSSWITGELPCLRYVNSIVIFCLNIWYRRWMLSDSIKLHQMTTPISKQDTRFYVVECTGVGVFV